MIRQLCIGICLALASAAIPSRAANRPHAGTDSQNIKVWTNDDLEKLHDVGLISIVGQMDEERSVPESAPKDYEPTQDPEWYADQAARLFHELEDRQVQLREYRQALDDARTLRETTDTVNLDEGDVGISPEAGIEILKRRVNEAEMELDALEDLARRNGIPPGTLRGQ
jgi:phage host-nuclease inhibitor protein Gam